MAKIFMPEATDQERLQIMRNHADNVEETTYDKDLTQDELDAKRETLVDNLIKVTTLEEELDGYKASYKGQIDPIKKKNKVLQQEVKTKKQRVKGTLFHMANHDTGFMETYEANGELFSTRRLLPEEKAPTRLFVAKPAANDE